MTPEALLILFAIGTATGLTLLAAAFVPARMRLRDILRDRQPLTSESGEPAVHPLARRIARVAGQVGMAVPVDDLDLVGQSRESFVLHRIGFALTGALWIPMLALILALGDIAPPGFLTGAVSLGATAVGWMLPAVLLHAKAARARAAFRAALAAYCHLVALGRLGDRGPVEALRYPAGLGTGWAFRRIRLAMDEAVLRGQMPWEGLQRLAASMGVRELKDLGHIITSAGRGGASIVDTLRAKAISIAGQQLAATKTGASVRSDRMDIPLALMGLAFIVFLAFPGLYIMIGK